MYKCNFDGCSAEFHKLWKIQEHVVKHTGQRPFVCDFQGCKKSFTRKPHLQRHQQTHTGRKDFVCTEVGCGQSFTLKDNLKKHIKRKHQSPDAFQFKCDHEGCDKTFSKKQTLKIHMYEHTNIKPFRCEHEGCGASFLIPSKLKRHAKQHAGYTCPEEGCSEVFYKWSLLRKHVADDHVTEHKCSDCNKVFYKRHKLRVHMKIHNDTKKVFVCPRENCQYSALKLDELDRHIQNYHEGARPFACSQDGCSKTFVNKHSLIRHQVVHSPGYVKPQPKPKKKRGISSHLASYPDEGTRGPRQSKGSLANQKPSTSSSPCQKEVSAQQGVSQAASPISTTHTKVALAEHESSEVEDTTTPSEGCDNIDSESDQTPPAVEQTVGADNPSVPQTVMYVTTTCASVVEESIKNGPIVETKQQCDIDVGAEIEIAHVDEDIQMHADTVIRTKSETNNDLVVHKQTQNLPDQTYTVNDVSLTADSEAIPEDLDSLIQAVTKSRNSTTKEIINTNLTIKDGVRHVVT